MSIRIHVMKTTDTLSPILEQWRGAISSRVTEVMKEYADAMVDLAQSIVPIRTGFLHNSIYAEIIDTFHVVFGALADYAAYVEYGTSRMAARPYMRPALEAYEQELANTLASEITEIFTRG